MTHVAEIVTFFLIDSTSPKEFVKLSKASEGFVKSVPGFAHWQLSQSEDYGVRS